MLPYLLNLATLTCINAILALTLNFIMGYAGIFSMAHAAFFGLGAYTSAFVALHFTNSIFVAIPVAMLACAVISLLLALPALRVRGEYFVAASLGLQIIGVTIFSEWKGFTGGLGGVIGIPAANVFGFEVIDPAHFLILTLIALIGVAAVVILLCRSSFGRNLQAIRDNESAASAMGKNVAVIKMLSVVVSTSLTAIAGALYAYYSGFINVESFGLDASVLFMAMVIIGGTGTIWGPIVGAVILMILPSLFSYMWFLPQSEIGAIQQIAYGIVMVLLMIFRPGGLVGSSAKRAAS